MAAALAGLALLAGCSSSSDDSEPPPPKPDRGLSSPEGLMIRHWLMAVETGDYERAARFFAHGAIIDQGRPIRLHDAAEARTFNATLPCYADLVSLRHRRGGRVLATFHLRPGLGGPCDGRVQVIYTIVDRRFTRWLQLREPAPEESPTV